MIAIWGKCYTCIMARSTSWHMMPRTSNKWIILELLYQHRKQNDFMNNTAFVAHVDEFFLNCNIELKAGNKQGEKGDYRVWTIPTLDILNILNGCHPSGWNYQLRVASLRCRVKGGQFVVVCSASPPKWMDRSGSNFQGVISTYGRMSSNIWVFKKLKYKKLCLVKLLGNTR